ncbi:mitochondrial 54S ribosomal protein bL21m [Dipodascopsis tothii]|uniref:mitochondrial 54S ribosomal protein bL21m n=1 Tax=Dipodascopsis tothii TaxID=44089 RepID=UPI0034CD2442
MFSSPLRINLLKTVAGRAALRPAWAPAFSTSARAFESSAQLTKPLKLNETIAQPSASDLRKAFGTVPAGVPAPAGAALYATFKIHSQSFLVTAGDTVTLPFRLKDVAVGDVLRITQIETFGNRNFTLKGAPFVDDKVCVVRARVVEHTKEPLRETIRTKRRNRRVKHIKSKHPYTVLRIAEIGVAPE